MANHKLSLDFPDTLTSCVFKIQDSSIYNQDISIKCPLLQITVPGFNTSKFVNNVEPNFSLNLSACDLKIQTINCGTIFNDLPDGIYIIKWSISPNEYVFVEYNSLRITKALNRIKNIYCDLDMGACNSVEIINKKLQKLRDIQDMLLAAKAKVEICRSSKIGLEIYNYAMSELTKMTCKSC